MQGDSGVEGLCDRDVPDGAVNRVTAGAKKLDGEGSQEMKMLLYFGG